MLLNAPHAKQPNKSIFKVEQKQIFISVLPFLLVQHAILPAHVASGAAIEANVCFLPPLSILSEKIYEPETERQYYNE